MGTAVKIWPLCCVGNGWFHSALPHEILSITSTHAITSANYNQSLNCKRPIFVSLEVIYWSQLQCTWDNFHTVRQASLKCTWSVLGEHAHFGLPETVKSIDHNSSILEAFYFWYMWRLCLQHDNLLIGFLLYYGLILLMYYSSVDIVKSLSAVFPVLLVVCLAWWLLY